MRQKLICIFWFGLIFLLVSIINRSFSEIIFDSPDESANYQVTREYGNTGNMYLTWKYLDIDYGNNLHPRWFITHNNKLVPFNFLGLPLFYGTFYTIFSDYIRYINIIFIFIVTVFLYKITEVLWILQKKNFWFIFIGILGCLPLLYYFNFPYYNIVPFIVFSIPFLYFILKFNNTGNIKYLYIWIFFSLIAIWMRYEQIIFIFLFLCINVILNKKIYFQRKYPYLHIFFLVLLSIFVFLIPLLLLNNSLYGSPFTYGYSLFTQTFFAEERTGNLWKSIGNILYQWHQFNLWILWINFKNNLFLISPIFFLLGHLSLCKKEVFKGAWLYVVLVFYMLIYAGMAPTYGSGVNEATIWNSIQRYWILVMVIYIFLFLFFLRRIKSKNTLLYILFMGIVIWNNIFSTNIDFQIQKIWRYENINKTLPINKEQYIISSQQGKFIFNKARVVGWWCWTDCEYHFEKTKEKMINTTKFLLKNKEEVYTFKSKRFSLDYNFKEFEKEGIWFELIEWNLYKLFLKSEDEKNN